MSCIEQHTVQLPWGACTFHLKRSTRRSIGLLVDAEGVHLTAPHNTPLALIQQVVQNKSDWIHRNIQRQAERKTQNTTLSDLLAHKQAIPIQGEPYQVSNHVGRAMLNPHTQHIALPQAPLDIQLKTLETLLKQHALGVFHQKAQELTQRVKLPPFRILLSNPKARWGSCDQAGNIRMNWRLIHHPMHRIEYVVAHELAHLLEMNHSARFWALVGRLMPNYPEAEAEFKLLSPAFVPWINPPSLG
jgi:predicted metal-dependent hydrolase